MNDRTHEVAPVAKRYFRTGNLVPSHRWDHAAAAGLALTISALKPYRRILPACQTILLPGGSIMFSNLHASTRGALETGEIVESGSTA